MYVRLRFNLQQNENKTWNPCMSQSLGQLHSILQDHQLRRFLAGLVSRGLRGITCNACSRQLERARERSKEPCLTEGPVYQNGKAAVERLKGKAKAQHLMCGSVFFLTGPWLDNPPTSRETNSPTSRERVGGLPRVFPAEL